MPADDMNLKVGIDISQAKKSLDEIRREMERLGAKSVGSLPQYSQAAGQYYQKATVEANKLGDAVGRIGTQGKFSIRVLEAFVLYRGFVGLQLGAIAVTKAFIDLDHQVSLIMTQLPNFGAGLREALTTQIVDTAKATGKSFNEVALAMYQITSAGYSGNEALKALNVTVQASVAGGTDATNAFNAALAQMNSFGLGMDQLNEIYDKQFQLVRRGIFSYEQLTAVVGITAEAAAQSGQSLETANAALAAISEVFTGPQLARGATGLRNLFQAISDEEKFSKLGVSTRLVNGEMRNLINILEDTKEVLGKMPSGERASAISMLVPDQREQAGLVALMEKLDSLKRNFVEQKLALGDLSKAYKVVQEDTHTTLQRTKMAIQEGFEPLGKFVGGAADMFMSLDKLLPGFTAKIVTLTTATMALAVAMAFVNSQAAGGGTRGAAFMAGMNKPNVHFGAYGPQTASAARFSKATSGFAMGGYILGSAVGTGIGSSGTTGPTAGGALGSIAAGGALGAPGGVVGVTVGASLGAISYLISSFQSESKEKGRLAARTFFDAFYEEMEKSNGNTERALAGIINPRNASGYSMADYRKGIASGMAIPPSYAEVAAFNPPSGGMRQNASIYGMTGGTGGHSVFSSAFKAAQTARSDVRSRKAEIELLGGTVEGSLPIATAQAIETAMAGASSDFIKMSQSIIVAFLDASEKDATIISRLDSLIDKFVQYGLEGRAVTSKLMLPFGIDLPIGFSGTTVAEDLGIGMEAEGELKPPLEEVKENLVSFADVLKEAYDQMRKNNDLASTGIELRAKMQNRGLTANEISELQHLEYSNHLIDVEEDHMLNLHEATVKLTEAFGAATEAVGGQTGEVIKSTEVVKQINGPKLMAMEAATLRRNVGMGLWSSSGVLDLGAIRSFDDRTGGLGRSGQPGTNGQSVALNRRVEAAVYGAFRQWMTSASRGGQTINFNGPTVPSELDLSIMQLKRLGPAMVRNASRSR